MATCETHGHIYGPDGSCLFCKTPRPSEPPDELAHAVRLLHVLRAWTRTPGDAPNPAREDRLYPLKNGKNELWKEIDILLERYPYGDAPTVGAKP